MKSGVTRIFLLVAALFLAAELASAKSIEIPDPEPYQKNQVERALLVTARNSAIQSSLVQEVHPQELRQWASNAENGMGTDDFPLDNALLKYILARELLNRQRSYELEDRQKKRNYWKQCAFNAVSCFGKK